MNPYMERFTIDTQPQDKSYSGVAWGANLELGSNTVILICSCDPEVMFGNGCFPKWSNFEVGAICRPIVSPCR